MNVDEDGESDSNKFYVKSRSFHELPPWIIDYILSHLTYTEVNRLREVSQSWNELISGNNCEIIQKAYSVLP